MASAILAMTAHSDTWSGTAAELIANLVKRHPNLTESREAFPRQPNVFGDELRRITPLLRNQGITITHTREGKERRRVMKAL